MSFVGLNADVFDELGQDGITEPSEVNASAQDNLIVVTGDVEDTDGESLLDAMDEYDIVIQTADDKKIYLDRLEDVSQDILAAEAISYADVVSVLSSMAANESEESVSFTLKQYEEQAVPLNALTEQRSTAGKVETKRFIEKEIRVNREKYEQSINDFITENYETFMSRLERFVPYIEKTIEEQKECTGKALSFLSRANESKNFNVFILRTEEHNVTERKLTDLRLAPFSSYGTISTMTKEISKANDVFKMISTEANAVIGKFLFEESSTRMAGHADFNISSSYLKKMCFEWSPSDRTSYINLSYLKLLSLYASSYVPSVLNNILLDIQKQRDVVVCLYESLITNGQEVAEIGDGLRYNKELLAGRILELMRVTSTVKSFLRQFKEFTKLSWIGLTIIDEIIA